MADTKKVTPQMSASALKKLAKEIQKRKTG